MTNEYCISLEQVLKAHGYMPTYWLGNKVPACCKNGCMVEANGVCIHECQSIWLASGIRSFWKIMLGKDAKRK